MNSGISQEDLEQIFEQVKFQLNGEVFPESIDQSQGEEHYIFRHSFDSKDQKWAFIITISKVNLDINPCK